ncbi:MAG TPA: SRPBCC family protein [Sediminibacterium sp.]|nr:SRPBCC family protein [Sediminibacterium sp.]
MRRLIRLGLFSLVIIFCVAAAIGLLLPGHILVSRATDVQAPVRRFRPFVTDIRAWPSWMEGLSASSIQLHPGTDTLVGPMQVSVQSVSDSSMVTIWTSKNGSRQIATFRWIPSADSATTIVQWQFEENLHWYPWERLGSMMNDKILGTMMEKNLQKLKILAEAH